MNWSPWRLEEVDSADEQYPMESHFVVRHTPLDEHDPRFDRRRSVSSVFVTSLALSWPWTSLVAASCLNSNEI